LVPVLEEDDDARERADRDAGERQRIGRDPRAREVRHSTRGSTAHTRRVRVFQASGAQAGAGRNRATKRRRCLWLTTAAATVATRIPATMSSQKWLPVAITQNQTQSGQISHSAFAHLERTMKNSPTPMISESAA